MNRKMQIREKKSAISSKKAENEASDDQLSDDNQPIVAKKETHTKPQPDLLSVILK